MIAVHVNVKVKLICMHASFLSFTRKTLSCLANGTASLCMGLHGWLPIRLIVSKLYKQLGKEAAYTTLTISPH